MKKIEIPSAGSYDKLKIVECEDLTPKAGEVVIDVKGIGINYADVCIRLGVYESAKKYVGWPITPGFETAGVIKEVGEGVTKWQVGQEVVAFSFFNGYASQVCVPETQILNVPPQFSLMQAAGFPAVFFTAFHALYHHVVLRPNSKILVHSAAGGVGTALTQLAKMAGHQVVVGLHYSPFSPSHFRSPSLAFLPGSTIHFEGRCPCSCSCSCSSSSSSS